MDLGIAATEVMDFLKAEFQSRQNDLTYKTVWGFLEAVEEASRKGLTDDLFMSGDLDADRRIIESLDQLLKR